MGQAARTRQPQPAAGRQPRVARPFYMPDSPRPPEPQGRETGSPSPSPRLIVGLGVTLAMILAFCLYTVREIRALRDEQTRISERNRLDSLQLLRIQINLSTLASSMRDMADGTERYEMVAWR